MACFEYTYLSYTKQRLFEWNQKATYSVRKKAINQYRIGNDSKAKEDQYVINQIDHLTYYFLLSYYLSQQDNSSISNYISKEDLDCFKYNMLCIGIDITEPIQIIGLEKGVNNITLLPDPVWE